MIPAIILGRKGSQGLPGKNLLPVLGRPLAWYPMVTAKRTTEIAKVFLSTDDPELASLALDLKVTLIDRPAHLATSSALGEDAFIHAYNIIKQDFAYEEIELIVLLFCNSPTLSIKSLSSAISKLRQTPFADSVVSVSRYNMWSPLRSRRLNSDGFLNPFVPFETFGDPSGLNCDRDSQGDVWFADMGFSVIRPHCLENLSNGLLPQKWMGNRILPFIQEAGCDVDYDWQLPVAEWWLRKFSDLEEITAINEVI